MKQAFLKRLSDHIHNHFPDTGNRLCVVLPNRRAGLFLKRYLVPQDEKPVWAPTILSVEDFTARLTGYTLPDPLDLMAAIYAAHQQIEKEDSVGFDEFYGRATGMLHDFEEVDHYLVNPEQLFSFLSESKAISLWNSEDTPLTDFERNYLEFFSAMQLYYKIFRLQLMDKKLATSGMASRILAESSQPMKDIQEWDHIIFAGFNALTPAQLSFIKTLTGQEKASMLWDADAWFMDNPIQEAGTFLRNYRNYKDLGPFGPVSDYFKEEAHEIILSGIPGLTGQANMAGHLIKQLMELDEASRGSTAVILADETLLLPLLNAIPLEAGAFNITMGYPLTQSPLFQLFNNIFQLHVNASLSDDNQTFRYYFKDLLSVLQHPYAIYLFDEEHLKALINHIIKSKRPFYAPEQLKLTSFSSANYTAEIEMIARNCTDAPALTELLQECISKVKAGISSVREGERLADIEVLFTLSRIVNRLQQFAVAQSFIAKLSTLQLLFTEAARQMPVAFYGEPLQGIQIMGLLETRTLDFDNVILLSVNEGVLPAAKSHLSYVPFDIRMHFGLPTHRDQQAIYAYHFYRLLMRSQKTWLIYNSEATQLGGGERSRFITQLQSEMPGYSDKVTISEITTSLSAKVTPVQEIVIEKDEAIMHRLKEIANRGFSPTSLTSYLNCSLRFYFSYILRLDEAEQSEEHIDHRTLGTVVHEVMQNLMLPLINSQLKPEDLKPDTERISREVSKAFNNNFPDGDITTGRNLLIATLAKKWIALALDKEISMLNEYDSVTVVSMEEPLKREIQISTPEGILAVFLIGKADRIDKRGGEILIIDYKTGSVAASELSITAVDDLFNDEKKLKEKAFQLLFYIFLAKKDVKLHHESANINAALFSFRAIAEGMQTLKLKEDPEIALNSFEENLTDVITNIFDPLKNFSQTTDDKRCLYCAFKTICQRN